MYYEKIGLAVTLCALVSAVSGASRNWTVEARDKIEHTFSRDAILDVDDVTGSIDVIADNNNTIRVNGERIVRAEDRDELDRAKREVTLDINEKDGVAQLYVNGPFRGWHGNGDHGFHDRADRHYEVTYNLTVHVPRATEVRLRTVNGSISATRTDGKFDVHNVDGSVTMTAIGGSGTARTVNGGLTVSFAEAPRAPVDLQTVNGGIDATFPAMLAADLHLKTVNGDAFTDFEGTSFGAASLPLRRRSGHTADVRVGSGGPELSFQTVNGNISIRKAAK